MTPKEKAEFLHALLGKENALFHVGEILNLIHDDHKPLSWRRYYQEVKAELLTIK